MKLVKIYVLVCPITLKVRYIGRTSTSLRNRLSQHVHEALYKERKYTHKVNWIQKLLKHNCRPVIRKLCEVKGWKESYVIEQQLIEKYADRLFNHRDRGEGSNYPKSSDHRNKIGHALKEGYASGKIKHPRSKVVHYYDNHGTHLGYFDSVKEAAEKLGMYRSMIEKVLTKEHVQAKGYRFSYKKTHMSDISGRSKGNTTQFTVKVGRKVYRFWTVKACREYFNLKGFANFKQTSNSLRKLGHKVST